MHTEAATQSEADRQLALVRVSLPPTLMGRYLFSGGQAAGSRIVRQLILILFPLGLELAESQLQHRYRP